MQAALLLETQSENEVVLNKCTFTNLVGYQFYKFFMLWLMMARSVGWDGIYFEYWFDLVWFSVIYDYGL